MYQLQHVCILLLNILFLIIQIANLLSVGSTSWILVNYIDSRIAVLLKHFKILPVENKIFYSVPIKHSSRKVNFTNSYMYCLVNICLLMITDILPFPFLEKM